IRRGQERSSGGTMQVESLEDSNYIRIAVRYQFAVETGEEREHRPVVGEDQTSERLESRASCLLGEHADQQDAQPLPLPGVIDYYCKLGVERLANHVLRHGDDPRFRGLRGLDH